MGHYIARRLLLMLPTLLGITLVTFFIIRLAPGDPVTFKLGHLGADLGVSAGGDAQASLDRQKQILKAKVRLGLMREGGTIRTWDARSGRELDVLKAEAGEIKSLAYSPDGRILASASADGLVALRDARTGRRLAVLRGESLGVNALAFSPHGRRLAAASDDRTVRVWELGPDPEGPHRLLWELRGHESIVNAVSFSPDGSRLATGSRDRTVMLWDPAVGREIGRLEGHYLGVTAVVFTRDGTSIISGSRDRSIIVWDPVELRRVGEFRGHSSAVHALALSPDGQVLAAGLSNNMVTLWDVESREVQGAFQGHTGAVYAVAFGPDDERLASASQDKSVWLWDLESRKPIAVMAEHNSQVNTVAFHPDGNLLASGALDTTPVPIHSAYLDWLWRITRLDMGRSFKDGRPVRDKILEALPVTLKLNVIAIFLTYIFSIPIGAYAAGRRNRLFDQSSSLVLFILYSMPSFWVATMLIILVGSPKGPTSEHLGFTLPFVGLHADNAGLLPYMDYLWDHILHLILPVIALTYSSFAFLSRLVRSSMLEVLGLDFVRTARAKGLAEVKVVGVHALRNSLIPVTTLLGNLLPALIGGSVIIEYIFSIPGMGALGFDAILQRDYPVIMAITTLAAVLTMLGILISDLLYCLIDPRIQLK